MGFLRLILTGSLVLVLVLAPQGAGGRPAKADPETPSAAGVQPSEEPEVPRPESLHPPPQLADAPAERVPIPCFEEPAPEAVASISPPPAPAPVPPRYPLVVNEWVQHFLERFQTPTRREMIGLWLNRSGRYLSMIREIFRRHGLPEELAYMAMIESGFNPEAVSRAGAKGLWQFMEHTARRYGLRVDRWVDERLDPEKATLAAALYLRDLFTQFGSWFLAKAAYNAGEMKVIRAVQRSRSDDFWALTRGRVLREETKRFVPAVMAATLIAQDPERYGFEVEPEPPMTYDLVLAPSMLDLKHLAARTPFSLEDLRRLNPELRRGVTPPGGSYALKVPPGNGVVTEMVLVEIRDVLAQGAVHLVKPGETLSHIAKRYRVTVAELLRWNGLKDPSRIFPGDRVRAAAR